MNCQLSHDGSQDGTVMYNVSVIQHKHLSECLVGVTVGNLLPAPGAGGSRLQSSWTLA